VIAAILGMKAKWMFLNNLMPGKQDDDESKEEEPE